ncbi:hypothetical protein HYV83_01220 [Candidatus Woesearchaeota archaeon]|nr:hypothetical protein [Candidatus Woesearchaeota archaeon]
MGLFGFLKKKGETSGTIQLPPEEPEFLKEIDTAAAGEPAENAIKEEVEPELALWLSNGATVRSLNELAAALKKLGAKDYKEHVNKERNELADWVQDILNDDSLARQLRRAKTKVQAAQAVEREMKNLKAARTTGKARRAAAKTEAPKREFRAAMRIPEISLPEAAETETPREEIQIPEIPELTEGLPAIEEPEEPKAVAKPKLSFWPFKKREKKMEPELAEMPYMPDMPNLEGEAGKELAEAAAIRGNPLSTPTGTFETEPQHEKWEELPAQDELPLAKTEETEQAEEMTEVPEDEEALHTGARERSLRRRQEKEAEEIEMPQEGPRLSHEARELEQMENALEREDEELNMKRIALTRRRYELIKRKGDLDKRRFDDFIRRQREATEREGSLAKESVSLPAEEESRETRLEGMPDFRLAGAYGKERLVALLEEAKQHIHENNVAEAQKALGEIQAVFNTVYIPAREKKQLEYEILEVEHDLKLASLR